MKKLITVSVTIILSFFLSAWDSPTGTADQNKKTPGDPFDYKAETEADLPEEAMTALKGSTTVFVLREDDRELKDEYARALAEAWTYSKIEVAMHDELEAYKDRNCSYFMLTGYTVSVTSQTGTTVTPIVYLCLISKYKIENKKGDDDVKTIYYARIELNPENASYRKYYNMKADKAIDYIYKEEVTIFNWTPGMMSLYLKDIQARLLESKRENAKAQIRFREELKALKNDTLYVPDNILKRISMVNGKEKTPWSAEKLFKKHKGPYKVVSPEELSEMILDKEVNYVLDYVCNYGIMYLRVYELNKGKLYQLYMEGVLKVKPKYIGLIL